LVASNLNKQGGEFSALSLSIQERGRKMKAKKILSVEDDGFSKGAMEKFLESEDNQNIQMNREQKYSLFQRGIFIALIVSLLTPFIIQISAAQEPFPKINRPNLRIMESHETCFEALTPPLAEDQKKALERLQHTYMTDARPIRTELLALKIQLRYLLLDPNVQPRVLFDRQRKISALHAELEELSLSYQIKARSVFTKDQLERLPHGWAFEMGFGYEIPIMDTSRRSKRGLQ
jgi:hypothetical protein